MNWQIQFTVAIAPSPKGRPRFAARGGRAIAYTPKKTLLWEARFRELSAPYRPAPKIDEPVDLELSFCIARPARLKRPRDLDGPIPYDGRPDLDNLVKAAMDGLDDFWLDDALVVRLESRKLYCARDQDPCVVVSIRPTSL